MRNPPFDFCSDIVIRQLKIGHNSKIKIAILYVKGMVDNQSVKDFVIDSIMNNQNLSEKLIPQAVLEVLTEDVIAVGGIKVVSDWEKLLTALMSGETITLIDGISKGVCASTQGGQRRSKAR